VEIDFYGDAPTLRNEFKVWLTSGFVEGSSIAEAPERFRTQTVKRTLVRYLRDEYERVTSDHLLFVCRASNRVTVVQASQFLVNREHDRGYELLSDDAVESIGREDYLRVVACLGQSIANKCFWRRRSLV
jgi:hypothetical protein